MDRNLIVTMNAGSSSLRCAVFERGSDLPDPLLRLSLRGLPEAMIWERKDERSGESLEEELTPPKADSDAQAVALAEMKDRLLAEVASERIAAFSHRVVHGGRGHTAPVIATEEVMTDLDALSPLAPSHQPHNLAVIRDLSSGFPGIPQVACFDTSFHRDLAQVDRVFALPRDLSEEGIVRYGFHGLSYDHVATALDDLAPDLSGGRVVVAHLGHGVSMCALKDGISVATTMGMTALDGLPMGRRPGSLDPGVVLYLIEERGMAPAEVREMLYDRCGLLGLSGISSDMNVLIQSDAPEAREAVEFFVYRCQREIGSLTAALGGIDALVLTGGLGEHVRDIRTRICAGLGWLGVELDHGANNAGETRISAPEARVPVFMIPTDEESVLAREAETMLED